MNHTVLIKLAQTVDKFSVRGGILNIPDVFTLAKSFGIDSKDSEFCDCSVDINTGEIEFHLYCESHHNGSEYGSKYYTFPLTQQNVDDLIKLLMPRALRIIENNLRNAEKIRIEKKFEEAAKNQIAEILKEQE